MRKGADIDMYAHPSFLRDNPIALLNLQKTSSKNKQRNYVLETPSTPPPRPISPSLPHIVSSAPNVKDVKRARKITIPKPNHHWPTLVESMRRPTPVSPTHPQRVLCAYSDCDSSSTGRNDRGKLDLLAFALEQEIACYHVH